MIDTVEPSAVQKILQRVVEEEIEFLARELVKHQDVRFTLWCWLLQNFSVHGVQAAGITDPNVISRLGKLFDILGVPVPKGSGPGGGGDSGSREEDPSGGGSDAPPVIAGSCVEPPSEDPVEGNTNLVEPGTNPVEPNTEPVEAGECAAAG